MLGLLCYHCNDKDGCTFITSKNGPMKLMSFLSVIVLLIAGVLGTRDLRAQDSNASPTVYCALHDEGNLALVNPETGKILRRIQVGRNPDQILLSASGDKLYVANGGDITVSVVDLAKNAVVQSIRMPVKRRGLSTGAITLSPDGKMLFIAERANDELPCNVYMVETDKDMITGTITAGPKISSIAVSHDNARLFVVNEGVGISVFPTEDRAKQVAVEALSGIADRIYAVACSPVAPKAYVTYGPANKIQILNTSSLKTEGEIPMPKYHTGSQLDITFSHDGARAFVINKKVDLKDIDGINVVNVADNTVMKIFNAGDCNRGLCITGDNRSFFTGTSELKWYNLTTLEHIKSIALRTPIYGIAIK